MNLDLFAFVDGENILLRYEAMLKNGAKPKQSVIHIPNLLAWSPEITTRYRGDIRRISYYQTIVGDEIALDIAKSKVSEVKYQFYSNYVGPRFSSGYDSQGTIYPKIYKKSSKSTKTKSVDINITVDTLRCVINKTGNVVYLFSGDGDYLPLVEELNRNGIQVWIGAFSSGLNSSLRNAADEFIDLDKLFFEQV